MHSPVIMCLRSIYICLCVYLCLFQCIWQYAFPSCLCLLCDCSYVCILCIFYVYLPYYKYFLCIYKLAVYISVSVYSLCICLYTFSMSMFILCVSLLETIYFVCFFPYVYVFVGSIYLPICMYFLCAYLLIVW